MEPRDPPVRRRRGLFVALLPLLVGMITVVAAIQPVPAPDGAVLAAVGRPALDSAARHESRSAARQASDPRSPILEPLPATGPLGRPVVRVPRSTAKSVPRSTAAAGGTAVFLGDSYTTGWKGAGIGARGWPRLVARARGWRTVNLAVAGTGFLNPGWTNQPVASRVASAIARKPDVVFVAAGHNDSRWTASATGRAADKVIARLHRALPDSILVIIGPIWPSGSPPARCTSLRDHLRRTAASIGAIFIDPLGERWFAGSRRSLIGSDGIHPTDAGHRSIARWVLAGLANAG
jgi:lysophospholipase L1-like esterase